MAKLWKWVLVGAAMIAPCMAKEILPPPYRLSLGVAPDALGRKAEGTELEVRLAVGRVGSDPAICSLEISCPVFKPEAARISVDEIDLLRNARRAANEEQPFKEEVWTAITDGSVSSVIESVKKGSGWVVTLTRGDQVATFLPREWERMERTLAEGYAAERWYHALLVKGKIPPETPEAHPPHSEGMEFASGERVEGRNLNFGISIRRFDQIPEKYRINYMLTASGAYAVRGIAEVPGRIGEAFDALRAGKAYLYEGDHFTVRANPETKEAELEVPDKRIKGAFNEGNAVEIGRLKEQAEARVLWLRKNEALFFKEMKKAR